ncbi:MAG: hypothetical protein GKR89_21890 [Candidatus Latescibacteria bacterium]|nr:hypothetical protein [Candidatus Latescibacterota bacterium]
MYSFFLTLIGLIWLTPVTAAPLLEVRVEAGERLQDWCGRLQAADLFTCDDLFRLAQEADFSNYSLVPPAAPPIDPNRPFIGNRFEGLLRPGAYRMPRPAAASSYERARTILDTLLKTSQAALAALSPVLGLNVRQQIILASIVEKEGVEGHNLPRIATVFHNRLARNDRLGSCPAVEYALGFHRPFLLHRDLEAVADSPYNLYHQAGLPPTPICFFSDRALQAVRAPRADSLVYFFVYDWAEGKHYFAPIDDLAGHRANAERAKANYRARHGDIRRLFPGKFYRP